LDNKEDVYFVEGFDHAISVIATQISTKPSYILPLRQISTNSEFTYTKITAVSLVEGTTGVSTMITYPSTDTTKQFECPNVNSIITCKYFEVDNSKLSTYKFKI